MTSGITKQKIAFFSLALLMLLPFIGPYRYYSAVDFMNDMLTMSCLTLLSISTLIYCKKIIIPNYFIVLASCGLLLILTTFFNSTYTQDRLNLTVWLIGAGLVSVCVSSIKYQYSDDQNFGLKLATYLFSSVFLMALYAFLTFYAATPVAQITHIMVFYTGYLRMDGLLGQPNLLAILLFLGICAGYYVVSDLNKKNYSYYLYLIMLWFISYCLFATVSRVALIALMGFIFYACSLAFMKKKYNNTVILFFFSIILAYLAYQLIHPYLIEYAIQQQWIPITLEDGNDFAGVDYNRATNLDHKVGEIKRALYIYSQNPFVGVGFGRYSYYSQQLTLADWPVYIVGFPYHSHNIVGQILAEFGTIGGIVLLTSIVMLAKLFIKSYRSKAHLFLFGLLTIYGLNALFEFALWNFNFAILFFALLAGFSSDKAIKISLLKTPLLKIVYGVFFAGFIVILLSRWTIMNTLNTIFSTPENVVFAQSMKDDRLMGLDFSNMYLSGIKFADATDKEYEREVEKIKKWRPSDMVYYRKVQLDIGNNDTQNITINIQKALKLGATTEMITELMAKDCQSKNQACQLGMAYINKVSQ